MVLISFLLVTIIGHTYWFQTLTNDEINTVTKMGLDTGNNIVEKNLRLPQPSICAASLRDFEKDKKFCLIKKTLAAETRKIEHIPKYVLISPSLDIVVKLETINTSGGIIIVAIVKANNIFLPLNSKKAKLNPAMVAITTLEILAIVAMTKELNI